MYSALPLIPLLLSAAAALPAGAAECDDRPAHLMEGLGSPEEEAERSAQLTGESPGEPMLLRTGGARVAGGCGGAVLLLPLRLDSVFNSRYPSGANDRLLWAGRGLSAMIQGGVAARWRWLSASIAPELAWQQNAWFEIQPNGRTGDLRYMSRGYGSALDLPQRFGAGPYATASWGQSYVRADAFNVALGFTTENLWLGPGIRNSLLMSSTAPGVPRAFVGTGRPADVWIGRLEALAFWGWLDRSRYFTEGGHPLLSGLALTFEPRWVPGLYLGAARVFVQPGTGLRVRDYFAILQGPWKSQTGFWSPSGDNPLDNQLGALWFRWVFPASQLELYGEWGKEDYSGSTVNGFLQDPTWTQAWLVGLQKLFPAGRGRLRLLVEATHLQELRGPPNYSWYTHGANLGYSNQGQLLGAGIGPGGDGQTLAIDWLSGAGRIGGYLERIGRNEGVYWNLADPATYAAPGTGHDVEITAAVRQLRRWGPVAIEWELGVQRRWNRDFLRHEVNLRGALKLVAGLGAPRPAEGTPAPVSATP